MPLVAGADMGSWRVVPTTRSEVYLVAGQTRIRRPYTNMLRSAGLSQRVAQRSAFGGSYRHAVISSPMRSKFSVCRAAAGDPYMMLGVSPDSSMDDINRNYSRLRYESRLDYSKLRALEGAHDRIIMEAFKKRVKDGAASDVKDMDSEPLFPWRPKRWDATPQVMAIVGAIQMGLAAFAFQAPNMSKVVGCMLIGVAGNVMKQNAINPPPEEPMMEEEENEEKGRSGSNFVRGAILALMATFVGLLVFSIPEILTQGLNVTLPPWMVAPGFLVSLKVLGSALCNWTMTSFYY
eukprot:gene8771-33638_t